MSGTYFIIRVGDGLLGGVNSMASVHPIGQQGQIFGELASCVLK